MNEKVERAVAGAVLRLLRPLVRILLRNGVAHGAFTELAKRVYVEVAAAEFGVPGRKQTVSRVALLTGLTRKEVQRINQCPSPDAAEALQRYQRAARIISGWRADPRFCDGGGRPAALSIEGETATFAELVRRYGADVPARAVLDELLRVGALEKLEDGRVRLLAPAYIPRSDKAEKLGILGQDVADLVSTIDHNLVCDAHEARFQRKCAYDNLPVESLAELRDLIGQHGQAFLELTDAWMSLHDRDANPQAVGSGRARAGVGVYYFEEVDPQAG
jgi:hypothetical protein